MEVAGSSALFRQAPCFSSNSSNGLQSRSFFPKQQRSNRKSSVVAMAEFSDKAHLQYYNNNLTYSRNGNGIKEEKEMMMMMMIKEEKEKKKKKKKKEMKKLLKKNLSVFEELMGFGLNLGLDEQVRGKMISVMELKMRKKEEKAKKKAAAAKTMMMMMKESSSSSSSSESECEKINVETTTTSASSSLMVVDDKQAIDKMDDKQVIESSSLNNSKIIEVCMGGKCKKSGAAMLLENFQRAVGGIDQLQVQVVGCKCMGKCRDGPNVKVTAVNNNNGNGNGNGLGLCMGVRLEDVDSIVNDYLFGAL
nr:Diacyglycerol acyltransferase 3 [Carthamus tinctorius]